jgi:hypothetical protein
MWYGYRELKAWYLLLVNSNSSTNEEKYLKNEQDLEQEFCEHVTEQIKSKLFTPMFTTKAKGPSFGLVVIKPMTNALGRKVTFEGQEGKGTIFIIRLPQACSCGFTVTNH